MMRPLAARFRCGSAAWTVPYRPSGFTFCINWNLFMGVSSTAAHHMAPEL